MEIVIKSFNGIGDLLFVTPTLRRIKEKYPDSRIVINTNYPELVLNNPFVDHISNKKEGVFLGYPDPIHAKWPSQHHIVSDWGIVSKEYGLSLDFPDLKPEIYLPLSPVKTSDIGVQVFHKGHWHAKKVWPYFHKLAARGGLFKPIPLQNTISDLVMKISQYKLVVCAEGGISHIAKAIGVPAVVIFGGFSKPDWNGYPDQINLVNTKKCSYCYNPGPCKHEVERICMKEISMDYVIKTINNEFNLKGAII